jgi:hypothetical protein
MIRNKISVYVIVFLSLFAFVRIADAARGEFHSSFLHRQTAETRFKGSVGQSRFEMNLRRDGERLSGSYFYVKSGKANSLNLRGTIDKSGKFFLRETDATASKPANLQASGRKKQMTRARRSKVNGKSRKTKNLNLLWHASR